MIIFTVILCFAAILMLIFWISGLIPDDDDNE